MTWLSLFIAGIFEIVWAVGLKYTEHFSRFWPTVLTIAAMVMSFFFLSLSLKTLSIGTAYAVWTGIGAVGTVLMGILLFNESREPLRMLFIGLIVIGIVGLRVSSGK